jgi:hypothetical protein
MPKSLPDRNKEYVLTHDFKGPPFIRAGTVVTNVRFRCEPGFMGDMLLFEVKGSTETYETHYGYMFAENTPNNLALLSKSQQVLAEYKKAKREWKNAFKAVATVLGPFEGGT